MSTPIGDIRRAYSAAMSVDAEIRRARLNEVCLSRGWVSQKTPGTGSAAELVQRLARSSSFWSDRLRGVKPIGAELAREIEEKLDLPRYYLDDTVSWPFSKALQQAIEKLSPEELLRAENVLRGMLGMPSIGAPLGGSSSTSGQRKRTGTHG